jgi:hypothetical protein
MMRNDSAMYRDLTRSMMFEPARAIEDTSHHIAELPQADMSLLPWSSQSLTSTQATTSSSIRDCSSSSLQQNAGLAPCE